jgi:hypothetical protein
MKPDFGVEQCGTIFGGLLISGVYQEKLLDVVGFSGVEFA